MNKIWVWIKAKTGRIITFSGALLQSIETLDISVIKEPLESWITHKGVELVTLLLFAASFVRHQLVANQHKTPPPPDDGK